MNALSAYSSAPIHGCRRALWHLTEAREGALEHSQAWFCHVSPKDRHIREARESLWAQTPSGPCLCRCAVSHSKEQGKKLFTISFYCCLPLNSCKPKTDGWSLVSAGARLLHPGHLVPWMLWWLHGTYFCSQMKWKPPQEQ